MASLKDFVKSVATILPEVPKPKQKPGLSEKFVWTAMALVLYLTMAITPLYDYGNKTDQFAFLRIIFASSQGTLMELGIGPIVTAGLILQLLQGSDLLKLDLGNPDDRAIFGSSTKILTFVVIAVEAGAYIIGGALGTLGQGQSIVIFFQLFLASIVVLLLDEMIQKGWGIGSGISLFILAGVAQTFMWYTFSPQLVSTSSVAGSPTVVFGFIPAFISAAFSNTLSTIVLRPDQYPDFVTFVLSIAVILFIIYIEGMRVEVPITSVKFKGLPGSLSDQAAVRLEHPGDTRLGADRERLFHRPSDLGPRQRGFMATLHHRGVRHQQQSDRRSRLLPHCSAGPRGHGGRPRSCGGLRGIPDDLRGTLR